MVVGLNLIHIPPKAAFFTMTLLTLTKLILAGGASDAVQYAVKVSLKPRLDRLHRFPERI